MGKMKNSIPAVIAGMLLLCLMMPGCGTMLGGGGGIHYSAEKGYTSRVDRDIREGIDVNLPNRYRETPLHLAAGAGRVETVQLLIERQADVNARDLFERTPLHSSASAGYGEVSKLLVEKGARIESLDILGRTPLHAAVEEGRMEIVELLTEQGADINNGGKYGRTPLHLAAERGYGDIVRFLLDRGAGVNARIFPWKRPFTALRIKAMRRLPSCWRKKGQTSTSAKGTERRLFTGRLREATLKLPGCLLKKEPM